MSGKPPLAYRTETCQRKTILPKCYKPDFNFHRSRPHFGKSIEVFCLPYLRSLSLLMIPEEFCVVEALDVKPS